MPNSKSPTTSKGKDGQKGSKQTKEQKLAMKKAEDERKAKEEYLKMRTEKWESEMKKRAAEEEGWCLPTSLFISFFYKLPLHGDNLMT